MVSSHKRLLTVDEIADICQVSRRTVYRWIESEDLCSIKIGRVLRIRQEDIEDFLDSKSTGKSKDA